MRIKYDAVVTENDYGARCSKCDEHLSAETEITITYDTQSGRVVDVRHKDYC